MTIYNMKSNGIDSYRLVKFDNSLNVEAVYNLMFYRGRWRCDCPASNRSTCKHREMAPKFIIARKVNKDYFYDYEKGEWMQWGKVKEE